MRPSQLAFVASFLLSPTNDVVVSENRAGPSNLGSVFSQIILCKQLAPDFNAEELRSIRKDSEDIQRIVDELAEFMPMEETYGMDSHYRNKVQGSFFSF